MGWTVIVYKDIEAMAKYDWAFEIRGVLDVLEAKSGWTVVTEKRNYFFPSSACLIIDKEGEE